MTANYFNDSPITSPKEDRFGIDHFARALAGSISELSTPIGSAIAINGPWGSGKSSAVNLIRHHLRSLQGEDKLGIIDFQCWWFRGEEALTLAFLQRLYSTLEKSLGEKAKDLIPKIGKKLLQAGPVVGPAINLATGGVWGSLVGNSVDFAKRFFSDSDTVETLFQRLSNALECQNRRFLVIIDDIDRLTPDEALLIFRLVKSVGRLPNIMYLLVFDRELAEKAVKQIYPSEGPQFLEKIIQASFELPLPARDDLNSAFLLEIDRRCGSPCDEEEVRRFMNIFYDTVSPYLNTPRDLARILNAIAVSWPPVAKEVNLADFVGLEVIRVFEPTIYNSIRTNKELLCGTKPTYHTGAKDNNIEFFIALCPEKYQSNISCALKRLFPRLENIIYGTDSLQQWEEHRLVCTQKHFDTYFRMAVGDNTLPINEIEKLIQRCGDQDYVKNTFKHAINVVRKNGKSRVPLLLDELNVHAGKVDKANFQPLISAIFEIADDIDLAADKEHGFSIGDNHLRIHWLIRKLTFERCDLPERSSILWEATQKSQLGWLVDFTRSAIGDYHPRVGRQPEPPEKCLIEKKRIGELKAHAIKMIENSAESDCLISHPRLLYILFCWRDFVEDNTDITREWTARQLSINTSVALLAKAFTSESWSQGMGMFGLGDRVAIRHTQAAVDSLNLLMDVEAFRRRLEELEKSQALEEPYNSYVLTFLDAWRKRDRREDD
ncbi:KAP family P-loop NTPase fold protein [Blastochloris sulfoviridis]|uniref:NTPase KAP n=1 Tax=Blastochloris sulfoviridis TaxID=50712 RepID=A0A5M6I1L4_9HYPH|nr:KAP family NTPase [Blastochloris sulfoviridis]KAA5602052.1 NTPase KAP [Blastochloris sulfoviridis]